MLRWINLYSALDHALNDFQIISQALVVLPASPFADRELVGVVILIQH